MPKIIDGKLVKCLIWRSGENIEQAVADLAEMGYTMAQSVPAAGDVPVFFDYFLPKELVTGDLITVPLGKKKVIFLDQAYTSKQIFGNGQQIYFVDWLLECIEMFNKIEDVTTLVIPVLPDCGKIWVVEV